MIFLLLSHHQSKIKNHKLEGSAPRADCPST
jgi:hypothetical protein